MKSSKPVIFGKKSEIEKYDLATKTRLWSSKLPVGFSPFAITQYENYVFVFSKAMLSQQISCFRQDTGKNLWHKEKMHVYEHDPFQPIFCDKHLYYLTKNNTVAKLCCETGKMIFRKPFKKPLFSSYQMILANDSLFLFSKKEVLTIDMEIGEITKDQTLFDKLNTMDIKASLGDGSCFISVIRSTHPSGDGSAGAGGDGGGDGGG